jgi:hypothetical protein
MLYHVRKLHSRFFLPALRSPEGWWECRHRHEAIGGEQQHDSSHDLLCPSPGKLAGKHHNCSKGQTTASRLLSQNIGKHATSNHAEPADAKTFYWHSSQAAVLSRCAAG